MDSPSNLLSKEVCISHERVKTFTNEKMDDGRLDILINTLMAKQDIVPSMGIHIWKQKQNVLKSS